MSILPFQRPPDAAPSTLLNDRALTVAEVCSYYLAHSDLRRRAGGLTDRTYNARRRYLDLFCESYGTRLVSGCRQDDLVAWVLDHPQWANSHTKSNAVSAVCGCFDWLAGEGQYIMASPFHRPRGLWEPPRPRTHATAEEYRSFMAAARPKQKAKAAVHRTKRKPRAPRRRVGTCMRMAAFFLFETGARTQEMRDLLFTHVDFRKGIAILHHHKTLHKTGKPRKIALGRALKLIAWLQRHRDPAANQEHVFLNFLGRPWSNNVFTRRFREIADRAGIRKKVTAYCLRHGFVVEGLHRGISAKSIADAVGHTTTRYVDWYGSEAKEDEAYLAAVVAQIRGRPAAAKGEPAADLFAAIPEPAAAGSNAELVELLRQTLAKLQGGKG
jgi:integrase